MHRSTSSGFTPNQQNEIAQTTQESYVDTGDGSTNGLPVGSYYYKIVAVDQLGNISTASGEGSGTVAADSSLPRASFAAPTPVSSSTVNGTVALTTSADAPTTTTTISYGFDPIGFRRSRTVNGTTTRFLLGGLIETTTTGSITGFDVDGPIGDLAHYSSAPSSSVNPNYSYYSGQGDLATEASHNGNRTRVVRLDPWGNPLASVGSPDMQELYTGRWDKKHDFVSGLIEMGVRPYEPGIGRFLSVDPIEGGSCGSYDYVCQDPINLHDLDGKAIPIWSLLCKIVCRPRLTRVAVPPAVLQAAKELGFNYIAYFRVPGGAIVEVLARTSVRGRTLVMDQVSIFTVSAPRPGTKGIELITHAVVSDLGGLRLFDEIVIYAHRMDKNGRIKRVVEKKIDLRKYLGFE